MLQFFRWTTRLGEESVMREIREFSVEGQPPVYVEITDDDVATGYTLVSRDVDATQIESMERALSTVRPAAEIIMETIDGLTVRPKEVEVNFGIKLSGKVGALIASSTAEGHFNVKLKWEPTG